MWSIGVTFGNSLPARERNKLRLGCRSSEGMWTMWITTASDSSGSTPLSAVSVVLCGTNASSAPCPLDGKSHTAADRGRSRALERKLASRRRSDSSCKLFKPSATDQFLVSS